MDKEVLLAGLLNKLVGYTAAATPVVQRLLRVQHRTVVDTPANSRLAYEQIQFEARGEKFMLAARHLRALGAKRAVIIAQGTDGCGGSEFTSNPHTLVEQLVSNGFGVLLLDLHGYSVSDTMYLTLDVCERHDVLGAADWLLNQGYAPGQIGVFNALIGEMVALGTMREKPVIRALVVDSSFAADPLAYCQNIVWFFQHALAQQLVPYTTNPLMPSATAPVHRKLEMRWEMTPSGLRRRWELESSVARDEAVQVADDPFGAAEHYANLPNLIV